MPRGFPRPRGAFHPPPHPQMRPTPLSQANAMLNVLSRRHIVIAWILSAPFIAYGLLLVLAALA
jgi:hypothetical protein